MILNAYAAIRKDFPSYTIDQCVKKTQRCCLFQKRRCTGLRLTRSLGPIHQLPCFPLQERKNQHCHARKRWNRTISNLKQ
ncbi:hypothetical protein C0J52_09567 [Blattella germanica]|nr:hypothetical protein C0J52_09567 [Blattella germanica]